MNSTPWVSALAVAVLALTACSSSQGSTQGEGTARSSTSAPTSASETPDPTGTPSAGELDCSLVTEDAIKEYLGRRGVAASAPGGGCRIEAAKVDKEIVIATWELLSEGQGIDDYLEDTLADYRDDAQTRRLDDGSQATEVVIADEDGLTNVALLTELDGRTLYVETGEIDGQLSLAKIRGLGVAIAQAQTP